MTPARPSSERVTTNGRHPMRVGMETRDVRLMVDALAENVVVHSPITDAPLFVGRETVAALLDLLVDRYEHWECRGEGEIGDTHVLVVRGRIGAREVELVDLLRHDANGKVVEMRFHGRPMHGIAAFAPAVGPPVLGRRSRLRAAFLRPLAWSLPRFLAVGDWLVTRLVGRP
jgi:hypothetical protein